MTARVVPRVVRPRCIQPLSPTMLRAAEMQAAGATRAAIAAELGASVHTVARWLEKVRNAKVDAAFVAKLGQEP